MERVKITFLANPVSPHVSQWLEVVKNEVDLTIIHIPSNTKPLISMGNVKLWSPLPQWFHRLPSAVNYLLLGLYLKLIHRADFFLHAHNASGYGLSALVSGSSYAVTTYGTEIYSMPKRSLLYRAMIRVIISNAKFITTTTPAMNAALKAYAEVDLSKVFCFSLGVSGTFLDVPVTKHASKITRWLVNRRVHPHYETHQVVDAFKAYLATGGGGELTLIEGDADKDYLHKIQLAIKDIPQIRLMRGFVSLSEMKQELDLADFSVSIPRSDQLSSAILESAARGTIPILRSLDAYHELESIAIFIPDNADIVNALVIAFRACASMSPGDYQKMSRAGRSLIVDKFSLDKAREIYFCLLSGEL